MSLPPGLLLIARQLHAALLLEIGHEIEIERLVSDGRYARDVLLVCDACAATTLPLLATQFRAMVAPVEAAEAEAMDTDIVMNMPDSMARRAMAAAWAKDSQPMPAAEAAGAPAPPARASPRPALRQAPAGSWLRRWWARLGRR